MAAANASLIITVATHGGVAFGIVQSYNIKRDAAAMPLQAQGVVGVSAIGVAAIGGMCDVTWVGGAGGDMVAVGTSGSLVFTSADAEGVGTQTRTLADMVALSGEIVHQDRNYCIYRQSFMNKTASAAFLTES